MNQTSPPASQESLLYIEFGERRNNAIVDQPLSLMERQEFHNIVARHYGNVIESISRRMVISFHRAENTLACARDLRSNVLVIRMRGGDRMGLYCRMLLLPAPPGARDPALWAEMALKLSLHMNNAPINGITAIEPFLAQLERTLATVRDELPALPASVFLTGGTSRSPQVKARVAACFPDVPLVQGDPSLGVVSGLAVAAALP